MKININTERIVSIILFVILFACPLFTSSFGVSNLAFFIAMVFLSLSLTLTWGYGGIFSFGQSAFFGIGAYSYAIFTMNTGNSALNFLGLLIGVLIGGFAAWILGYFMFYGGVNDVFVGLITMCVTLVLATFMGQTAGSQWRIGQVQLGGFNGVNGIPPLQIGPVMLTGINFYYFTLLVLLAIFILLKWFIVSRFGMTLIALRENRERTKLLGYNVPKIQTLIFALGGTLASLSGILYVSWGGYTTPTVFSLASATVPAVLVATGGRKNSTAAIIFTLLYYWFSQTLSSSGSQFALIILGFVLVLAILFVPKGIVVALFNWGDHILFKKNKVDYGKRMGVAHEK